MKTQQAKNPFHSDTFRKEQIARRLKNRALEYWGLKEGDGGQLDPIVDMLLGACSVEFERTAQEINSSQSRLLERLAQLMVPEVYTNARPAHALMHARPDSPVLQLKPEDQFFVEKEVQEESKILNVPVTFSPATSCRLFDCTIVCQAAGNKINIYDNPLQKGKILCGDNKEQLPASSLWLGLRMNPKIESIQGLPFYFDWKNEGAAAKYLPLLSLTRWYAGEAALETTAGNERKEKERLSEFNGMEELEEQVQQYYQRHFVTVVKNEEPLQLSKYPSPFEEVFPEEQLKGLKEELLWLEVRFSGLSDQQPLQDLLCAVNCFPVMNRKLNENNRPFSLSPGLNIIPIQTREHLLSIRRVYSDQRPYRSLSFREMQEAEDGIYSIRQGGVSRFDQRNAATLLRYLYDMLRDESASFSAFGHHALATEIRSLDQGLSRLQLHFLEKLNQQQSSKCHLLLHTRKPEDVWLEYWSTQAGLANHLPAGKKAAPLTNSSVKRESLQLITPSTGGREPMSEGEKLHAYKHTLLTRNRVVTGEDIKSACFAELGEKLERVEIKKGFKKEPSSKKGFVSTLDVVLTPARGFEGMDWQGAGRELQALLERKKMFLTGIQVYALKEEEHVSGRR